ncbi:tautomerase family protein [Donghicola sp.]|jgi:malonate semialdehyde decarboxylase|uniref:tautomerase family protein n=1 Tax=Donghicola sp. TaxID=1929294 RepID=UPI0025DB4513|nr:tautomerase family protein [Donghicola sp.]MCT4579633.1 tautomerase family protein [Donghicola sp.]
MPLIRFYVQEGRTPEATRTLLDSAHEVVADVFGVPRRDRYQIVTEHKPGQMILEDTGLGFERDPSEQILVQVFTSPRAQDAKLAFYDKLAAKLQDVCGLDPKNLMISIFENTQADWSFGFGRAQYVTGELG